MKHFQTFRDSILCAFQFSNVLSVVLEILKPSKHETLKDVYGKRYGGNVSLLPSNETSNHAMRFAGDNGESLLVKILPLMDCVNEVLAYEIAKILGYFVPFTSFCRLHYKGESFIGICQQWIPNCKNFEDIPESRQDFEERNNADISRMYAFDVLISNIDRHGGNFLIRQEYFNTPEIVMIDHNLSFCARADTSRRIAELLCDAVVPKFRVKIAREIIFALPRIQRIMREYETLYRSNGGESPERYQIDTDSWISALMTVERKGRI